MGQKVYITKIKKQKKREENDLEGRWLRVTWAERERKGNGGAKISEEDRISRPERSQELGVRGSSQHGNMAHYDKVADSGKQSGSQYNQLPLCLQKSHVTGRHHYWAENGCHSQLPPPQPCIIQLSI